MLDPTDAIALAVAIQATPALGARQLHAAHVAATPPASAGGPRLEHWLRLADRGRSTSPPAALQAEAERLLHRAAAGGSTPLILGHPDYPPLLAQIIDPPLVLWVRGADDALRAPVVALVGARAASAPGREVAAVLAADLARSGLVVASGLARGIDSAAHRGALECGRSIAVLGSGSDVIYPPEHRGLADAIAARGAVLSELLPGSPPRKHHFPLRNRILSGLSLAVIVVEAAEKSGSLITARLALEQGREVMAVPGNVLGARNRGAHALIRDGARLVESAADVLEELGMTQVGTQVGTEVPASAVPASRTALLAAMSPGDPTALDTLVAATGRPAAALLGDLLELELAGHVRRVGAAQFMRVHRPVVT